MFIQPLRIGNRLLVQFKVNAVAYWLIRRSRGLGSRQGKGKRKEKRKGKEGR